jgi:surface antigen
MDSKMKGALQGMGLAVATVLLSGCGMNFSLLPANGEPSRTELSEWQYRTLLEQPLKAVPDEISEQLPQAHRADAARFLTRTLETAPDGVSRHWQSIDRSAALAIRPVSTAVNGRTVCRNAILRLETADGGQEATLHACRSENGVWTR